MKLFLLVFGQIKFLQCTNKNKQEVNTLYLRREICLFLFLVPFDQGCVKITPLSKVG